MPDQALERARRRVDERTAAVLDVDEAEVGATRVVPMETSALLLSGTDVDYRELNRVMTLCAHSACAQIAAGVHPVAVIRGVLTQTFALGFFTAEEKGAVE